MSFDPVETTCRHCGTTFTTRAKATTHCPGCRAGVRIKRGNNTKPQVTASPVSTTAVTTRVIETVSAQRVTRPATPEPFPELSEPDPSDDNDIRNRTFDAIKQAVVDNKAQQLTAPAEIIQLVERTIISVMPDEPTLRYQTGFTDYGLMTLRLWSDNEELLMPKIAATVVPALDNVARQIRSFRTEKVQRCDWPDCGARRYVDTPELYTVQSPAFSRQLNLCHRHMMMEVSVIGCNVKVASA